MAPLFAEPRLPPLENPFLSCECLAFEPRNDAEARAIQTTWALRRYVPSMIRRRHSIGGYVPHALAAAEPPQVAEGGGPSPSWCAGSCKDTDLPGDDVGEAAAYGPVPPEDWPCTDDEFEVAPPPPRLAGKGGPAEPGSDRAVAPAGVPAASTVPAQGLVLELDRGTPKGGAEPAAAQPHKPAGASPASLRRPHAEREQGPPRRSAGGVGRLGDGVTTVMVRNLRRDLQREDLLAQLDAGGFADLYDFMYLPCTFESHECKGYAFINFTSSGAARAFAAQDAPCRCGGLACADGPALDVSAAALQGLEVNLRRWDKPRSHRIRNPAFGPFVRGRRLQHGARRTSGPDDARAGSPPEAAEARGKSTLRKTPPGQ